MNSIAPNRTLFLKDNLPVLRGLNSESIDLIVADPPFNKGMRAFEGTTKAGMGSTGMPNDLTTTVPPGVWYSWMNLRRRRT